MASDASGTAEAGGSGAKPSQQNPKSIGEDDYIVFSSISKFNPFTDPNSAVTEDWFNDGPSSLSLRTIDKDAIVKSIAESKKAMAGVETDFTEVARKKPRLSED